MGPALNACLIGRWCGRWFGRWSMLCAIVTTACQVSDVVHEELFACEISAQCIEGYVCDRERQVCVRDDGSYDSGPPRADAAPYDDGAAPGRADVDPVSVPDGRATDGAVADGRATDGAVDDGRATDGGPDAREHDAAPPSPDGTLPPVVEILPYSSAGGPGRDRAPIGPVEMINPSLRWQIDLGGRPSNPSLLAADFDGDGIIEIAIIEGGRVTAFTVGGDALWATEPLAVHTLGGVVDLDGDGRRELVVASAAHVYVLDALTGSVQWSTPPPTDDVPPDGVTETGRVMVEDVDGDGWPELYVADRACGRDGGGQGHLFDFQAGFGEVALVALPADDVPREYRCGIWQTFADLDGDGRVELIFPDRTRILPVDLRDGQLAARLDPVPLDDYPSAIRKHVVADVDLDGDDEIVALFDFIGSGPFPAQRRVLLIDLADGHLTHRVVADWAETETMETDSLGLLDVDGDDHPEILVTVRPDDEAPWQVRALRARDGQPVAVWEDARLRGLVDVDGDGRRELILREGDSPTPQVYGTLVVRDSEGDVRYRLAGTAIVHAPEGFRQSRRTHDMRSDPLHFVVDGHGWLVVTRDVDGDGVIDEVQMVDDQGGIRGAMTVDGKTGAAAILRTALPGRPEPTDRLVLATTRHGVGIYDDALTLLNDQNDDGTADLRRSTGEALVAAGDVRGVGVAEPVVIKDGRLIALTALGQARWSRYLHRSAEPPQIDQLVPDGPSEIVVQDGRDAAATRWLVLDGETGETIWSHARPSDVYRAQGPPVLVELDGAPGIDLVRMDARLDEEGGAVLVALRGADGQEIWQVSLPPSDTGTGRPSAVDADGDGVPELYVAMGRDLCRLKLDGAGGPPEVSTFRDAAEYPGAVLQATGYQPPLLKTRGAGPLGAFSADLERRWTADPFGDPAQWLGRTAIVVGDEVWAQPGRGHAIGRWDLETGAGAGQIALAGGALLADPSDPVTELPYLVALQDLRGDGRPGALAAGPDGDLYALTSDGGVAWARRFGVAIGDPVPADTDADGKLELLVPLGNGTLALLDEGGLPPPTEVWDNDGIDLAGGADNDVDEVDSLSLRCADWPVVPEADGYQARVVNVIGFPLTEWTEVESTAICFGGIAMTPANVYAVEVRAWRQGRNGPELSDRTRSDGAIARDIWPPLARLTPQPTVVLSGARQLRIGLFAADDDRIAAWRLEVHTPDGAARLLTAQPAAAPQIHEDYLWQWAHNDGTGTGDHQIIATVTDRAGNRTTARADFVICPPPEEPADPRCP